MNSIIEQDLETICRSDIDWEKFKNSSVLVTGATGMLGSYIIYVLNYLNYTFKLNISILCLVRNSFKIISLCSGLKIFEDSFNMSYIIGDVEADICKKVDYIIHTASPANSSIYSVSPVSVITANVMGTKNLLDLAVESQSKGVLFLSSGEVSGKVDKDIMTEDDYGYLNPLDVRSCYGESKRMAENMCKCYSYQYGVPVKIARPDHTYGPSMNLKTDGRVFAEFVSNVVDNKDIVIKSDGTAIRTFNYISDATEGFFRVLLYGDSGECYNVSNRKGRTSISNLAKILVSLYPEKQLKVVYRDRNKKDTYMENKNKFCPSLDISKIKKLGYSCKFDLKEGFKRTINSYIERGK
jgi:nucleoside-diphosphate-sugar epimerase